MIGLAIVASRQPNSSLWFLLCFFLFDIAIITGPFADNVTYSPGKFTQDVRRETSSSRILFPY